MARPRSDEAPPRTAAAMACPICRAPVAAVAEWAPFCSPRCRLIDLGRWLGGEYRVELPVDAADRDGTLDETPDSEDIP